MSLRSNRMSFVGLVILSLVAGGCAGSGCGCLQPLKAPVPADQTIEGGAQIRITPTGFQKLTSILPGLLNDAVKDGFCIPRTNLFDITIASVTLCVENDCAGGQTGCRVDIHLDSLNMSAPDPQTFRVDTQFDVFSLSDLGTGVTVDAGWLGSCTWDVSLANARIVADIALGIKDDNGELDVKLRDIKTLDISGLDVGGCGLWGKILGPMINFIADILSTPLGNFIVSALTPVLNGFIQDLIPSPLGMEGIVDLGAQLGSLGQGVDAKLELKGTVGGYVSLPANGLSVGMILGLNADADPATRTPELDSEPARCVPPFGAIDFAQPPASLTHPKRSNGSERPTFALLPADAFLGAPDPAADLVFGLSETVLDLAGHHLVSSSMMCLGVSSSLQPAQLHLQTVGFLFDKLDGSEYLDPAEGKHTPLFLALRPQKALDFTIGDNVVTGCDGLGTDQDPCSPALTIHLRDLEIDWYAYVFQRWVRAVTYSVSMDIGLGLEFVPDATTGKLGIKPTLVGAKEYEDKVLTIASNAEFISATEEDAKLLSGALGGFLPTVISLAAAPLSAEPIALPEIGGFSLDNLQVGKVTTSQDDFLAIYASLVPGSAKMGQIERSRRWNAMARSLAPAAPFVPVEAAARVTRINVPTDDAIKAWALRREGGALPEVEVELGGRAAEGDLLEWQYSIDGGLYHPFATTNPLVIRDPALMFQGPHTVRVTARAVGDARTYDQTPVELPIVIDTSAPHLYVEKTALDRAGTSVVFVAKDMVSAPEKLEFAFTEPTEGAKPTAWQKSSTLSVEQAQVLSGELGIVRVFCRDEAGHVSANDVDVSQIVAFHGRAAPSASGGGCGGCQVGARTSLPSGSQALLLLGVGLLAMMALRRRRTGLVTLALALFSVGCGTGLVGGTPEMVIDPPVEKQCKVDEDCITFCPPAGKPDKTVPYCTKKGKCSCDNEVPYGSMGEFSDLVSADDGTVWVSSYNRTYGDLVVAKVDPASGANYQIPPDQWEFVDGLPAGAPVRKLAKVRKGNEKPGDDVGRWTSIALSADNEPMVVYYDKTSLSLKYARREGKEWKTSIIDKGTVAMDDVSASTDVGWYATLSVSPADGRPVVFYFVQIEDAAGVKTTELRMATVEVEKPTESDLWTRYFVDQAPSPVPAPFTGDDPKNDPAGLDSLPEGVGLFASSAHLSDGAPVVAYYDRIRGDLKLAIFDAELNMPTEAIVLDGAEKSFTGNADVGLYPSVSVDSADWIHITYQDATHDNLLYLTVADLGETISLPEVIDDGYRIDGKTADGLDKPVFHMIGDDSNILVLGSLTLVVYQDATSHELLLATRDNATGLWNRESIAGALEDPTQPYESFKGGYGFFARAVLSGKDLVMSSFALNLPSDERTHWVEVFRREVLIE